MSEPSRKLKDALPALQRSWSPERAERVQASMLRRRRRRLVMRGAGSALLLLVISVAGVQLWRRPAVMTFADGSTATLLDRRTVLRVAESSPRRVVIDLDRGRARFDVTHVEGRVFRVQAGRVAVEVLGTQFVVDRVLDEVTVAVERGRVRVLGGDQERVLGLGEQLSVRGAHGEGEDRGATPTPAPPEPASPEPASPEPASPEPAGAAAADLGKAEVVRPEPSLAEPPVRPPTTRSHAGDKPGHHAPPPANRAVPTWKGPAEEGDFDKAYEELIRGGAKAVRDVPNELLLAADVTRLSHHPAEAVPLLERVARDHSTDPRAPLAAFALGRVLLEDLGRPQQAADAFARARALSPNGPLASDALAREVEAWSRAGDSTAARARAEEYLRRYPKGGRIKSVRRFGGIE